MKDCRKGNLQGLILDSLLQHGDWSCLPSSIVDCLFERGNGAMRHLPTLRCPFWRWVMQWVTQLIITITSDFSALPSSLSSVSIMAMGVIGYGWTLRVLTTPTTPGLASGNKALPLSPRKQIHHVLPRSGQWKIFGSYQKGYLRQMMGGDFNPSTEAENQGEGRANSPTNDPLPFQHSQGAIDSLYSRYLAI